MKPYTAIYLKAMNFTTADFVPCEICGKKAIDLHHIWARSLKKALVNDIKNIIAVCRECHVKYGDQEQYRDLLQQKHNLKLKEHGIL